MGSQEDRMKGSGAKGLLHILLVIVLLSDSYCKARLHTQPRSRRQVEDGDVSEDGLGATLAKFMVADEDTQFEYIQYWAKLAEYHFLESYDLINQKTDAQDRVFLESVQNVLDAVRTADEDPARTSAAIAELATNPDNLLLFSGLVITTIFVAQFSSFVLFGSSLSTTLQEGDESSDNPLGGIMAVIMRTLSNLPNFLNGLAEMINQVVTGTSGDDSSSNSTTVATNTTTSTSVSDTASDTNSASDSESGSENGEEGSIFDPILEFINNIIRQQDEDETTQNDQAGVEGSGEEEDEDDSDLHLGVDVPQGSLLDMIINIFPHEDESEDENAVEGSGETSTQNPGDLGISIGGASVSLHPIDLANLFVQVQEIVGVNCSCAEGQTADMITNTTLRLLEESMDEAKKLRQYSSLSSERVPKKGDHNNAKAAAAAKLAARRKMWSPRVPKSL